MPSQRATTLEALLRARFDAPCTAPCRHAHVRRSWSPPDGPRSFVGNLWVHLIGSMDIPPGTSLGVAVLVHMLTRRLRCHNSLRTTSKAQPRAFHSFSFSCGSSGTLQTLSALSGPDWYRLSSLWQSTSALPTLSSSRNAFTTTS